MERAEDRAEALGGYIFVSHSHDDLYKVRQVRNYLESREIEPILFYLHCMKSENPEDMTELWDLICREIDARNWFLYLDSKNARNSEWVKREMEYAEKSKDGHIVRLDLNKTLPEVQEKIAKLGKAMRVYISHSRRDRELYLEVKNEFERQDFQVLGDEEPFHMLASLTDWEKEATKTIRTIAEDGCFVPLITRNSLQMDYMYHEIQYAHNYMQSEFILPMAMEDIYSHICKSRYRDVLYQYPVAIYNGYDNLDKCVEQIRKALIRTVNQ